jgi:hypothetical protein
VRHPKKENLEAFARALCDPQLLVRKIKDSMQQYRLSFAWIKRAQREARDKLLREQGKEGLAEIRRKVRRRRFKDCLYAIGKRYPGLLDAVLCTNNYAALARKHGITRERVRQIREYLLSCSRDDLTPPPEPPRKPGPKRHSGF